MPQAPEIISLKKNNQDAILEFSRQCMDLSSDQINTRERFRSIDLEYATQLDWSDETVKTKLLAAMRGDPTKFRNIILPVIMPQVETAVAFQVNIFLSGYPIFATLAAPGNEDVALQMDAVIAEQQVRGDWITECTNMFRAGTKYNLAASETQWHRVTSFGVGSQGDLTEVLWEGNKVRALDMYNTYFDNRIAPRRVTRQGEFAGYLELYSRTALIQLMNSLGRVPNRDKVLSSPPATDVASNADNGRSYYIPPLNFNHYLRHGLASQGLNWESWAGMAGAKVGSLSYKGMYTVNKLYGRIIPKEFGFIGVPGDDIPQVWEFYIVNDAYVISARRLTNAHDMLPIDLVQPLDDAIPYQPRSFAENLSPFQSVMSALTNSSIAARRRAASGRLLYDPARVSSQFLRSDSPVGAIPVRASSSTSDVRLGVTQLPFEDGQFQINQTELQGYSAYADKVSGLNQTRQGQFIKGNKTRAEFETIQANSVSRDMLAAYAYEGGLFTPMKEKIKFNILQYQQPGTYLNAEMRQEAEVDPVRLRQTATQFKMPDGLMPTDKLMDADSFNTALTAITQNQMLGQGYNVTKMFSYLMKSRGANLTPFEKTDQQQAFEQATAQWQQAVAQAGQQVALALQHNKELGVDEIQQLIESATKSLPPQPKPEDYGYDTGNKLKAAPEKSIMDQLIGDEGGQPIEENSNAQLT